MKDKDWEHGFTQDYDLSQSSRKLLPWLQHTNTKLELKDLGRFNSNKKGLTGDGEFVSNPRIWKLKLEY